MTSGTRRWGRMGEGRDLALAALLVFLSCSCDWVVLAASERRAGTTTAPKQPLRPPYWREARLAKELTIVGTTRLAEGLQRPEPDPEIRAFRAFQEVRMMHNMLVKGAELSQTIQRQTGVPTTLQPEWLHAEFLMPRTNRPAREVMDALAVSVDGRWFRVGKTWVLARNNEDARLILVPQPERIAHYEKLMGRCVRSLTAAQWRQTTDPNGLAFVHLAPQQRAVVLQMIRLFRLDPDQPFIPGAQALTGTGVSLLVLGDGEKAELFLRTPGNSGEDIWDIATDFYSNGKLTWGIPPPR